MSAIEPVDLPRAYLLLNHGPTVLVTSAHGAERNVMAAAWAMPLDFSPPKMLVVVDKNTYTRALIEASGEFALCIPSRAQAQATLQVGSHSGRDEDKFQASGLATFRPQDRRAADRRLPRLARMQGGARAAQPAGLRPVHRRGGGRLGRARRVLRQSLAFQRRRAPLGALRRGRLVLRHRRSVFSR